ncbi:MAG: hypothetical protein OQK58_00590, partial [Gammaproteobacteria bacterium]|nr:hypothetical protein [Gammaproteobacteria bacterium]
EQWGSLVALAIALVALIMALMAWRRAGHALQLMRETPEIKVQHEEQVQQVESRPEVSLEISANKNEFEQVSLKLSNTGILAARKINITIDKPNNIYDVEGLSDGTATVATNSVIIPKLAVLDVKNKLPVKEIVPGNSIELPAALTMSHGKICDFPVTLRWKDEKGLSQQKQLTLTV